MKTASIRLIAFLALLLCCHWSFAGKPDAGVTLVGEWSEAVRDADGHTLRGRLVVCDDRPASNRARVYLELEHGGSNAPVEVYHDIEGTALNLELRDEHDRLVPRRVFAVRRLALPACWATLLCDSTVRLRSDLYAVSLTPNPEGLLFLLGSGTWVIPANAATDFYLSGTFTPSADHPSPLKYHVWKGTLKLPKVKIPPPSQTAKAG